MSGRSARNTRAPRFVGPANRLANLIRTGLVARAILRVIDATSHGRHVEAMEPDNAALAGGESERRGATMQLAARLAEAFGPWEAYEAPTKRSLETGRTSGPGGRQ